MNLISITDFNNLTFYKEEWDRINNLNGNIFLSFGWITNIINYYCNSSYKLFVIIAFNDDQKIIAIIPLVTTSFLKCTRVKLLGSGEVCADHLDIIYDKKHSLPNDLFYNVLNYLRTNLTKNIIVDFNHIKTDSAFFDQMKVLNPNFLYIFKHNSSGCPYILLPRDWKTYASSLSIDFSKKISYYLRRIERNPNFEIHITKNINEAKDVLSSLFQLNKKRWSSKNRLGTLEPNSYLSSFHLTFAISQFTSDVLLVYLKCKNEIIGVLYCFKFQKTIYYYNSGFNPDFSKYSPGTVLIAYTIHYAIQNKYTIFDFLRGNEDYKNKWTNNIITDSRFLSFSKNFFGITFYISYKSSFLFKCFKRIAKKHFYKLLTINLGMTNSNKKRQAYYSNAD